MLHEKDFIMREIERIVAVIARILQLKQHDDLDGALEVIQHSYTELFGPLGEFLAQADVATVTQLITDPVQMAGLARLLRIEANVRESAGDSKAADVIKRRALELALEAYRRDDHGVADARHVVGQLRDGVAEESLVPEYREVLWELAKAVTPQSEVQKGARE